MGRVNTTVDPLGRSTDCLTCPAVDRNAIAIVLLRRCIVSLHTASHNPHTTALDDCPHELCLRVRLLLAEPLPVKTR